MLKELWYTYVSKGSGPGASVCVWGGEEGGRVGREVGVGRCEWGLGREVGVVVG